MSITRLRNARRVSSAGIIAAGLRYPIDVDAENYLAAVEAADGERLEDAVRIAVSLFVMGCKTDGIWSAIKASCILCGARTLSGALTPLVGSAPTNNNFVSGDYDRKTGLVGNGTSKALDTGRNNDADPQDNNHNAVFLTAVGGNVAGAARTLIGSNGTGINGSNVILLSGANSTLQTRSRCSTITSHSDVQTNRLFATSRQSSSTYNVRVNGSTSSVSQASSTTEASRVWVFRRADTSSPTYAYSRLAFYSIGESLDLALLDSRVRALYEAIGGGIV